VFQETAVWCWAAVAEMVFRHYGQPNLSPVGDYQCGVVGATAALGILPSSCAGNCALCITTLGTPAQYVRLLEEYPTLARTLSGAATRAISVQFTNAPIAFGRVQAAIDAGHPVVTGITPAGIPSVFGPAHVALVIGYRFGPGGQRLIVNDPYPYGVGPLGPYGDPYLVRGAVWVGRGQYDMEYSAYVSGLAWTQTFEPR
jgi:hypothetical protein